MEMVSWRCMVVFVGVLLFCCCGRIKPAAATQAILPPADHESVLAALRTAGLSSFAETLNTAIAEDGFLLPGNATIFVPTNSAIKSYSHQQLSSSEYYSSQQLLIDVFSYHVISENFPFEVLTSLPVGTQIPTLLLKSTLLVTHNKPSSGPSRFRINNRSLMAADLCTDVQTVACHAVDAVFDSTTWGQAESNNIFAAATPPILPPVGAPLLPPVGAPVIPPVGAPVVPPVGAPVVPPVGAPVTPPAMAPGAGVPAFPFPVSPGGAPLPSGAPGAPGASPPGNSAAVISTHACQSVMAAVVVALTTVTKFFV